MTRCSCALAVTPLLGAILCAPGCAVRDTPPDSPAASQPAASGPAADEGTISVPPRWQDIGALVARLRSDDPMTRVRAIRALGRIEDAMAHREMARPAGPVLPLAPPLMVAGRIGPAGEHIYMLDPVSGAIVRYRPAAARVQWMTRAVPALVAATSDKDACVRYAAVWALADMDDPPAHVFRAIEGALADKDRWVGQAAAVAYAELTRRDAAIQPPALFPSALEEEVNRLIFGGADPKELAALGPKALPAVLEVLKDVEAWDAPGTAQWFAQRMRLFGPRGVQALGELLADEKHPVGQRAASVLGHMGSMAVPALGRALRDRRMPVRRLSLSALASIVQAARKERKTLPDVRSALAKLAVALGQCLTEDQPLARQRAATLLLYARGEGIVGLAPALRDRRVAVRKTAMRVLTEIVGRNEVLFGEIPSAPKTVSALVEMLKDKDAALRIKAIDVLGRLGPVAKAAIPALEAAVKDRDLLTALSAVEALKAIRAKDKKDK